jgi:hypothetical protein
MQDEGGYHSFPLAAARGDQGPYEVYGRGPAQIVLPSLKTLNAQKTDFLTQGHRAAAPAYLVKDDGIVGFSTRPGAMNKGAMSEDGKPLIGILPTGNIQTNEKMMEMEKAIIDDAFLVSLFKLILDEKILTATQVTEIVNQKGILIAPSLGRQQSGYLQPMITREIELLARQRKIPPPPNEIKEAGGIEYRVDFQSPISKMQRMPEAAAAMRTLQIAHDVAQFSGDPSIYDVFDFTTMMPDIAEIEGMPETWMSSKQAIARKARNRAQQAQQQMQLQAMPSQAAMMKAQAAQFKAGMGQQQQGGAPQEQQPQQQLAGP